MRHLGIAAVLRLREEVRLVRPVAQRVELRAAVVEDVLARARLAAQQDAAQVVAVEDAIPRRRRPRQRGQGGQEVHHRPHVRRRPRERWCPATRRSRARACRPRRCAPLAPRSGPAEPACSSKSDQGPLSLETMTSVCRRGRARAGCPPPAPRSSRSPRSRRRRGRGGSCPRTAGEANRGRCGMVCAR